jgi:hypothetical protein
MAYSRARVIRNPSSVTIDDVEYKGQVTKATLTPDTPIQTLRTFGGIDQDRDSTSWTLELAGHQDRGTGGLAKALDTAAAAGDAVEVVITPRDETGEDVATCTVIPVPVSFGGEAGSWKLFEAEFPVVDQPVFTQSV